NIRAVRRLWPGIEANCYKASYVQLSGAPRTQRYTVARAGLRAATPVCDPYSLAVLRINLGIKESENDELAIASLSRDLVCLFSHAIGLPTGPRTSNNYGDSQHRFLLWTLHGQNDTKFCFSAHHAGVALGRFNERVLFNHWAYAGHLREA